MHVERALEIGVLHPQHHGAGVVTGKKEVVEGGSGAAHVQRSRGAGGETNTNVIHGHRHSVCQVLSTSATAWAAMPSRLPVKPIPSVVVPRTPTWEGSTPSVSAIAFRIAARWRQMRGASQITTTSTLETVQPPSLSIRATFSSSIRLSTPS